MAYNLTNVTDNSYNLYQIGYNLNSAINGWLGLSIVIFSFILLLISFSSRPIKEALVISAFINSLITYFLFLMGWVGITILTSMIVLFLITIAVNLIMKD